MNALLLFCCIDILKWNSIFFNEEDYMRSSILLELDPFVE